MTTSAVTFNYRFQLSVLSEPQIIDTGLVAERKRAVYQKQRVPAVLLTVESNDALRQLALFVRFTHQSSRQRRIAQYGYYEKNGMLYDILVTARQNGLYCHFLGAQENVPLAEQLYMPRGDSDDLVKDRAQLVTTIRQAVKEWRTLVTDELLRLRVNQILNQTKPQLRWSVVATNWAAYFRHALYDTPGGRLYGTGGARWQDRFVFAAVDVDDESQYQWEPLFAAYLEANPRPPDDELASEANQTSMQFPPYTERLLDRTCLTLVVLDVGGSNDAPPVLVGYVTCSLRAVKPQKVSRHPQLPASIRAFQRKVAAEEARADCGYDVFSIDGAHITPAYWGTKDLFRAMMFHTVEFVRQSHRALGLSIMIADSQAAATKTVLASLGFEHYNAVTSLTWLLIALEDFVATLAKKKTRLRTPPKYLKLATKSDDNEEDSIVSLMDEFLRVYDVEKVRMIREQLNQYRPGEKSEQKLREKLPDQVRELKKVRKLLEKSDEYEQLNSDIRLILDSVDTDDTFLFLDKSLSDGDLFAASDRFAEQFRQAPQQPVPQAELEDRRSFSPVKSPQKRPVSDAEEVSVQDLALYDQWALYDKPDVPLPTSVGPMVAAVFVMTAEEAEAEEQSRAAQESYQRALIEAVNEKIGRTKLRITLKRNK